MMGEAESSSVQCLDVFPFSTLPFQKNIPKVSEDGEYPFYVWQL